MKYKGRILIVDDEKTLCETLSEILEEEGYQIQTAFDGEKALEKMKDNFFDVVFCDLKMPKLDGLSLLEKGQVLLPETFFIVITAFGSMETTVEALKKGAHDYVIKPLFFDDILLKLKHLLDFKKLKFENRFLKERTIQDQFVFDNILGQGSEMKAIYSLVQKVAATQSTILITGETGVGKKILAKAIHFQSLQKEKKFISICCGNYTPSQLEKILFGETGLFNVEEGTIFLDEIFDLEENLQFKLTSALQPDGAPHRKGIRLIISSAKDLSREVLQRTFREDLYYRINVVEIKIPPLRGRKNDIPFLVKYFVKTFSEELGKKVKYVTDEALEILMNCSWRGNIRELQNILERAILLIRSDTQFVGVDDLPSEIVSLSQSPKQCNFKDVMRHHEAKHIQWVLKRNHFDKKKTADELGLSLSSLYRKIEELSMHHSN